MSKKGKCEICKKDVEGIIAVEVNGGTVDLCKSCLQHVMWQQFR